MYAGIVLMVYVVIGAVLGVVAIRLRRHDEYKITDLELIAGFSLFWGPAYLMYFIEKGRG